MTFEQVLEIAKWLAYGSLACSGGGVLYVIFLIIKHRANWRSIFLALKIDE